MIWIPIALLAVILILLAVSYFFFKYAIVRTRSAPDYLSHVSGPEWEERLRLIGIGKEWMSSQTWDEMRIVSRDGLKLCALYLPVENSKKSFILFHGYRSSAEHDFCCSVKYLHDLGYNLLIPYQRAHGKSEGEYIGFGVFERYDCVDWANELTKRLGEDSEIVLLGISMGASTVLMASDLELPDSVKCIVADCGFTTPYEIMASVSKTYFHFPAFPIVDLISFFSKRIAKYGLKDASTVEALKRTRLPVMFVHGQRDRFVPPYMSEQNYEACVMDKCIMRSENAVHGTSWLDDTDKYVEMLSDFLAKHLTDP